MKWPPSKYIYHAVSVSVLTLLLPLCFILKYPEIEFDFACHNIYIKLFTLPLALHVAARKHCRYCNTLLLQSAFIVRRSPRAGDGLPPEQRMAGPPNQLVLFIFPELFAIRGRLPAAPAFDLKQHFSIGSIYYRGKRYYFKCGSGFRLAPCMSAIIRIYITYERLGNSVNATRL